MKSFPDEIDVIQRSNSSYKENQLIILLAELSPRMLRQKTGIFTRKQNSGIEEAVRSCGQQRMPH
jgi:hypothetical protein